MRGNGGDPFLALLRRGDRALDVLGAAARRVIQSRSVGWIDDLVDCATRRADPIAVDQHFHGVPLRSWRTLPAIPSRSLMQISHYVNEYCSCFP